MRTIQEGDPVLAATFLSVLVGQECHGRGRSGYVLPATTPPDRHAMNSGGFPNSISDQVYRRPLPPGFAADIRDEVYSVAMAVFLGQVLTVQGPGDTLLNELDLLRISAQAVDHHEVYR